MSTDPQDHIDHAAFALTGCFHEGDLILALDVNNMAPIEKAMMAQALRIAAQELSGLALTEHRAHVAETN